VAPGLLRHTGKLFNEVPAFLEGVSNGEIAEEIGDKYEWSEARELRLKEFLIRHREETQNLVRSGERYTSSAAQAIGWLVVIPVLAIFFLHDGDHIASTLIQIASMGGKYPAVHEVADEIHLIIKRYVRAKVILCGLSLIFYSAAMLVLRFPHAIVLGFLGGALEFIPVAGWIVSMAMIVGVGALGHSHWIWMAVLLGMWRAVQDYYTSPRVMGRELEIHPLMAIFAVMVGGEIGGIIGIYLLVPVIAAIRVIWRRYVPPGSQPQSAPVLVHTAIHE